MSVFVICEIGSNHGGDYHSAIEHIHAAAKAGANAVKFQSYLADELVPEGPDKDLLTGLQMPKDWYVGLKEYAEANGLTWFSTVSNATTLRWMEDTNADMYKIASPTITHLPLIRKAAETGKPLIISTGLASFADIDEAVSTCVEVGNHELTLLHCVSEYPTPPGRLNLLVMHTLKSMYPFPVGFSDHSLGISASLAAVALGATVIEKHFTLDRTLPGPDHHYALEPNEFRAMVDGIREVEQSLGEPHKMGRISSPSLRTLHAARDIRKGRKIRAEDITTIRPDDGLQPVYHEVLVGAIARKAFSKGEPITWEVFRA